MSYGPLKIGELINKPTKLIPLSGVSDEIYVFQETLDLSKYKDITSNYNWYNVGMQYYDFLFCRNQIMTHTAISGFTNLNLEEKEVACITYSTDKTNIDTIYTSEEQLINWNNFVANAQSNRKARWNQAKNYISYSIGFAEAFDLANETETLSNMFLTYGIESFSGDGVNGLFDYLASTNAYSATGYSSKVYHTQLHEDNILSILQDGFPLSGV